MASTRIKLLACSLLTTLLLGAPATADEYLLRAKVMAGESHRVDTPVTVEVELRKKLEELVGKVPIAVLASRTDIGHDDPAAHSPAQMVPIDDKRVRIVWIVGDLPAGKDRVYDLHISPVLAGETEKQGVFAWKDSSTSPTRSTDLLLGDRPVLRYMWTPFDKGNIELTKKPFHHVFAPAGGPLLTKGPGGLYPHHRGIYFGYNKCKIGDKSYDTWHAAKGEHEVHVKVLSQTVGPVAGGHTLQINWNDRDGKTFAEETRRLTVFRQSKGRRLIEFHSELRATAGPVRLDGDRQHAGVQFRASQHVAENQKQTRYLRPAEWADLAPNAQINSKEHRDLPWNALQFPIEDTTYTVAYLSDPSNPDGADFSERLYGRFGEFFPWDLSKDNPLTVRYRWWIDATGKVARDDIVQRYEDLAQPPKVVVLK